MLPSDPTSHYYSHNAARLAEEYDRAGDGLLPIIEKNCPDKSARILDYGCGTGRDLARLSKKGYTNLMGYDPSTEMIAAGRIKCSSRSVNENGSPGVASPPAGKILNRNEKR